MIGDGKRFLDAAIRRLRRLRSRVLTGLRIRQICPYPFTRMVLPADNFVPCCQTFLEPELFQARAGEDPWNGSQAQKLRAEILKNSYRFCRREICQVTPLTLGELFFVRWLYQDVRLSLGNLWAICRGKTVLPKGPTALQVDSDPRCQLACPSCRKEKIEQLGPAQQIEIQESERQVDRHRADLRILVMSGDGEALVSPWMRGLLMTADRDRFSAIEEVHLQTNGLLCDAESFRALRPGSDSIRRINVSIDAGTAEVYRVVRGGDWEKLMKNLLWIGEQRRSGRIRRFTITFTVRRANFRTMPDFVRLGRRFGVDRVQFTAFVAHGRMAIPDPAAETVFSPAHPDDPEFAEIFSKLRKDPLVLMRIPAPSRFGGSPRTESRLAPVALPSQSAFFPEGR